MTVCIVGVIHLDKLKVVILIGSVVTIILSLCICVWIFSSYAGTDVDVAEVNIVPAVPDTLFTVPEPASALDFNTSQTVDSDYSLPDGAKTPADPNLIFGGPKPTPRLVLDADEVAALDIDYTCEVPIEAIINNEPGYEESFEFLTYFNEGMRDLSYFPFTAVNLSQSHKALL